MSKATKITGIAVFIVAVGFGIAFAGARYLVSRLDGTGGVHAPQQHMLPYSSEDGVSFAYPDTYELSSRTEGTAERRWDVLLLVPAGYAAPQGGEGPPAISMDVFPNPEGLSLRQWVQGDARSNYKLSADGAITAGKVGGEEALFYTHSGLYEADAAAVMHGGKVFLFEAGSMSPDDAIRSDFSNLLKTVQFN